MSMSASPSTSTSLTGLVQAHILPYLTVSIHQILRLRGIYPARAFLLTRAYNFPVHQCRHPGVCGWVGDAVEAVGREILRVGGGGPAGVKGVGVVIYECESEREQNTSTTTGDDGGGGKGEEEGEGEEKGNGRGRKENGEMKVRECWMFDLSGLVHVPRGEEATMFEDVTTTTTTTPTTNVDGIIGSDHDDEQQPAAVHVDLEEQFRAALSRMNGAARRLKPLNGVSGAGTGIPGAGIRRYSFSVVLMVAQKGDGPVSSGEKGRKGGEGGEWVAANAGVEERLGLRNPGITGGAMRKTKTIPIRRVESGPVKMEMWVEEVEED